MVTLVLGSDGTIWREFPHCVHCLCTSSTSQLSSVIVLEFLEYVDVMSCKNKSVKITMFTQ